MCYHFLAPYICVNLSIEGQLEYLSYAAHLALVLYVHKNTCSNFIPTLLYIDLMIMVKNVFFCVAKAKIDTPNNDFSIVLLGTESCICVSFNTVAILLWSPGTQVWCIHKDLVCTSHLKDRMKLLAIKACLGVMIENLS
jgi:hypothetical protein